MKIVMLSVCDDGKKIQLNPGDVVDTSIKNAVIDDEEAKRLISVGGARPQNDAEIKADLEVVAKVDQAKADADKAALDAKK